ncbi:hypothetical protein EG329_003697 [Mollisiaceae sp. DMI_Dod_QoI]|nr:hypothetical protein EG329_003697 [Helotiales sp. DMI_Dod_QoI]
MPIWSIQLILLSIDFILTTLVVSITNNTPSEVVKSGGKSFTINPGTQNWDVANLVLALLGLGLTCTEIVLYIYSDLSPTIFLGSSLMKAVTWTIVLVLDVTAISSNWEKGPWNNYILYVMVGFAGAVYVILLIGVVYGVVVFFRQRGTVAHNVERYMKTNEAGILSRNGR